MKCSKCGNNLKEFDKFCTMCGTKVQQDKFNNDNTYTLKKHYEIAIFIGIMGILILIYSIKSIAVSLSSSAIDLFFPVIVGFLTYVLAAMAIINEISFHCPNCKEEITLNQNGLTTINNDEFAHKCPKCNKELIFNNKELSVKINDSIEQAQEDTSNTVKLEELYNLKTKGIITEEEFEQKKQEFLDKM